MSPHCLSGNSGLKKCAGIPSGVSHQKNFHVPFSSMLFRAYAKRVLPLVLFQIQKGCLYTRAYP